MVLPIKTMGIPLPRRFVILILSVGTFVLFLHTFAPHTLPPVLVPSSPEHESDASYFSPSKWLPPILNPGLGVPPPPEFDEDGQCLFLSPFDALSKYEKERAGLLDLIEVSPGIIRAKAPPIASDADPDFDDEFSGESNMTRSMPSGLTHPILGLIRDGERKWNERLTNQSKTLDEAVQYYVKKWGRQPPKGFDKWCVISCCLTLTDAFSNGSNRANHPGNRWSFAVSRHTLLIDEYDA